MEETRGYVFRLYPTKEQAKIIELNIDGAKGVYNYALRKKKEDYIRQLEEIIPQYGIAPFPKDEEKPESEEKPSNEPKSKAERKDWYDRAGTYYSHSLTEKICEEMNIPLVKKKNGEIDYAKSKEAYKKAGGGYKTTVLKVPLSEFTHGENADYYREMDSVAISGALRNLNTAYTNAFKHDFGFPAYKRRGYRNKETHLPDLDRVNGSYTTASTNAKVQGFVMTDINKPEGLDEYFCMVTLSKLGKVKMRMHRPFPKDAVIGNYARIRKTPAGEFYIAFTVQYEDNEKRKKAQKTGKVVGMNVTMVDRYVFRTSEGKVIEAMDEETQEKIQRIQVHIEQLQQVAAGKTKGSNNWKKQMARIAKLQDRITKEKDYALRQTAKKIVSEYDVIFLEDINFKEMKKKPEMVKDDVTITERERELCLKYHKDDLAELDEQLKIKAHIRRFIQDMSPANLENYMEAEAVKQEKKIHKISRYYPSNQTCSCCGAINEEMKGLLALKNRTFTCPKCGFTEDRDINAARNVLAKGIEEGKAAG